MRPSEIAMLTALPLIALFLLYYFFVRGSEKVRYWRLMRRPEYRHAATLLASENPRDPPGTAFKAAVAYLESTGIATNVAKENLRLIRRTAEGDVETLMAKNEQEDGKAYRS